MTDSLEDILSHLVSVVPCSMLFSVCSIFFFFSFSFLRFFLSNLLPRYRVRCSPLYLVLFFSFSKYFIATA